MEIKLQNFIQNEKKILHSLLYSLLNNLSAFCWHCSSTGWDSTVCRNSKKNLCWPVVVNCTIFIAHIY